MEKKSILIIDDEAEFIEALDMRFEALGWRVLSAPDGGEGFSKAKKEKPDLILLDLVMPKSNGMETLHKLKTNPWTSGIPVIILTAKTEDEYVKDAMSLGASEYMVKPLSLKSVVETVRKYLI